MREATLYSSDMSPVTTVLVPSRSVAPTVLLWGDRCFVRDLSRDLTGEYREVQAVRVYTHRETAEAKAVDLRLV